MEKLVAIIGPTGVGKSGTALRIAEQFGGEIISADSRQVYRFMDIGTAKPPPHEQETVPHYAIDAADPDEVFSLADFIDIAHEKIEEISLKGKIPLLAGGTGQYAWAILEGWEIPRVEPAIQLRKKLEARAASGEGQALYNELEELNPKAAARIDYRITRRVIRALEIALTGTVFTKPKKQPRYNSLIIGLTAPRSFLYGLIDTRVEQMIENGLIEEVKSLLEMGYAPDLPSMSGIGYRQIISYLQDNLSLADAVSSIKNESHRLVRMQYNWFSLQDTRIKWFDITEPEYQDTITATVKGFICNS
ncbi:MAG: tRNA (adenosine(37)-N6)-dimethylallyltransferase MiaA [Dehalococcoidales bacterium]|nr:tRNA (adenosine(37)-N6)-dimethylallyltransferase MiaA [Dehalococcoidales bacterium]